MLFTQYQEFIVFPLDPDKVKSQQDRLNTGQGFRVNTNGVYPPDYTPSSEQGAVVPIEHIVFDNDQFEAMEVTDSGHVNIWTRDRVWFLMREGSNNQIERMKFVQRNPNF